ncbi:MAG: hypothetical protein GY859_25525 [Desulfobacterales bacterium]|nr:hypothetical protein [Desulfobacterales bacterium]
MAAYHVFDLEIHSQFETPPFEGAPGDPSREPDVVIRRGALPEKLEGARKFGVCYQLGRDALRLNVPGVAGYLARNGREIIVDPGPDAPPAAVNAFLLDAPLTGILHQRGALPLYGAAVQVGGGCALLCGVSGVGKSTAAGELIKRGRKLLTDDLAAVAEQNGKLVVRPGYPSRRLPVDVITRDGLDPGDYPRARPGLAQRRIPVAGEDWAGATLPLKKIYILTTWNDTGLSLEALEADDQKFNLLHGAMHRQYLSGMGGGFALVKLTARLMKETPAAQVLHGRRAADIEPMIDALEEDMASDNAFF